VLKVFAKKYFKIERLNICNKPLSLKTHPPPPLPPFVRPESKKPPGGGFIELSLVDKK